MKQIAYILAAGTIFTAQLMACSDSGTGGSGQVLAGAGGSDAGSGGSTAGTNSTGGSNNTAGKAQGGQAQAGSDPFGGGGSAQAGQGQAGSGGGGQADCQTCQQDSCSGELTTCGQNPDCAATLQCYNGCKDQACADKCIADHPAGKTDFEAGINCIVQNCADACGGGGGGGDIKCTQVGLGDNGGPCDTCGHDKCCAEIEGCFNNAGCNALNKCLADNNCADQACAQKCADANPTGAASFQALGQCIQGSCGTECKQ